MESIESVNIFNKKDIKEKKKIGSGGFGKVIAGTFKNLEIAIKKFFKFIEADFLREFTIIKKLRHNNIPQLYGLYKDEDQLHIVNELVTGGTLDSYIRLAGQNCFLKVLAFLDLASVLTYIHSKRLIHRDLKPSNVMMDEKLNVKLLDFGISKISANTNTNTITTGTVLYMAPENFNLNTQGMSMEEFSYSLISTKVDVWAFGCMLSEAFSGERPWGPLIKEDSLVIAMLYKKKEFLIPNTIVDPNIVDLIKACTKINPIERKNIKEVKEMLLMILHETLKRFNINEVLEVLTLSDFHKRILAGKVDYYLKELKTLRVSQIYYENLERLKIKEMLGQEAKELEPEDKDTAGSNESTQELEMEKIKNTFNPLYAKDFGDDQIILKKIDEFRKQKKKLDSKPKKSMKKGFSREDYIDKEYGFEMKMSSGKKGKKKIEHEEFDFNHDIVD